MRGSILLLLSTGALLSMSFLLAEEQVESQAPSVPPKSTKKEETEKAKDQEKEKSEAKTVKAEPAKTATDAKESSVAEEKKQRAKESRKSKEALAAANEHKNEKSWAYVGELWLEW